MRVWYLAAHEHKSPNPSHHLRLHSRPMLEPLRRRNLRMQRDQSPDRRGAQGRSQALRNAHCRGVDPAGNPPRERQSQTGRRLSQTGEPLGIERAAVAALSCDWTPKPAQTLRLNVPLAQISNPRIIAGRQLRLIPNPIIQENGQSTLLPREK